MSLNTTPSGERLHIGLFGRRNAGKSSLLNAIIGQPLAIVSRDKGTTTDPVQKSMELLPLGPVVLIDTPGLDDEGTLGELRKKKTIQALNKTDIALLVIDASVGMTSEDTEILEQIQNRKIPCILVQNKADLTTAAGQNPGSSPVAVSNPVAASNPVAVSDLTTASIPVISVSTKTGQNIDALKNQIAAAAPKPENSRPLVRDLVQSGDTVLLVIPIDSAAPKGRLILPQQQTIRELLEAGIPVITVRDSELTASLHLLKQPPALVITDSQVFGTVSQQLPQDILLTSFSILFARKKGNLDLLVQGAHALKQLEDGDTVLICEGCTHHRQCEDIGTVKLPRRIQNYTGKDLQFQFTSGTGFPEDLSPFRLIIHCGGCMLNEKEMQFRLKCAQTAGIPMTNYGIAIACMHDILERSLEPFDCKFAI